MSNPFDIVDQYRALLLSQYAAVVPALRQALERLPAAALHRSLGPGEWSPHQEFAYLRDMEQRLFWPCLQALLAEPEPRLESDFPLDRADWLQGYSPHEPLERILAEWAALRRQELEQVQGLPRAAWNRTGRHPRWGVRTLQWWVERSLASSRKVLRRLESG